VQQRTRDTTDPQSQYSGTALQSLRSKHLRQCTPKTRNVHRKYDAAMVITRTPQYKHEHDVLHSRGNCALGKHLHAHNHTQATHNTAHSSHIPTPLTEKYTQSFRATLTSELSGCSVSTGCCRTVGCCASPSTCKTHEQTSRHTMAPDATANPSQPPATHLHASHSINEIESNEKSVSKRHAIAEQQLV
jgi:hypothetical protein